MFCREWRVYLSTYHIGRIKIAPLYGHQAGENRVVLLYVQKLTLILQKSTYILIIKISSLKLKIRRR